MLITFEGGEGAGKSTLVDSLYDWLKSQGVNVIKTREPGGTELGDQIRELLLSARKGVKICPQAELLLVLAARTQHIKEVIKPTLDSGAIVLCDRFNDSTIAYQGGARGLGVRYVEELCEKACEGTLPNLTFYLDVDVEEGLSRVEKLEATDSKKGTGDRFESEKEIFHQRVKETFLFLIERDPERFQCIDASQSKEEVFSKASKVIESRYGTFNR